jgi:CIC family chloride channel protein
MLNAISLDSIINRDYTAINKKMPIADFYKILASSNANIFAVLNNAGNLEGVIWMDEIRKQLFTAIEEGNTVADIMVTSPAIIDYTEPVSNLMDLFDKLDVWQLPVVKDGRFEGFVSKSALLSKYREMIIQQYNETDLFAK